MPLSAGKSPNPTSDVVNEHKDGNFVLGRPEEESFGNQERTKTSILCSKSQKTGVPDRKSAQKPQFCARKARKRGSRRPKKHKNPDFVLEKPENGGSEGQKRTKTSILCSGREEIGIGKRNRRDVYPSCKSPRTLLKRKYLITK